MFKRHTYYILLSNQFASLAREISIFTLLNIHQIYRILFVLTESEILEAIAQFDFLARSERELSFNKGDVLVLHSQVSSDWWRGSFQGKQGLIPDKYILLKIRCVLKLVSYILTNYEDEMDLIVYCYL